MLHMEEEQKKTRRQSEKEDEAHSQVTQVALGSDKKAGVSLTPPAQEGNKFVLFQLTKLL